MQRVKTKAADSKDIREGIELFEEKASWEKNIQECAGNVRASGKELNLLGLGKYYVYGRREDIKYDHKGQD